MPKAEKGTPKDIANRMKSKGLQKLRWYCQVCEKQCRDENGFKCHAMSESHLRQMLVVGENAGKHISDYSQQFLDEFMGLLSRRWNTKRVRANQVYQEYIQDKNHLHMNSTRWVSLTEFVKYLGREGLAKVDETEKGWFVEWIDNSPKALAKLDATKKKERGEMDDEQRQRKLLAKQIERARQEEEATSAAVPPPEASTSTSTSTATAEPAAPAAAPAPSGPIKISFGAKKIAPLPSSSSSSSTTTTATTGLPTPPPTNSTDSGSGSSKSPSPPTATAPPVVPKLAFAPKPTGSIAPTPGLFKKSASTASSGAGLGTGGTGGGKRPLSAVEQLFNEEQERKRRREEASWSRDGHGKAGLQMRRY